MFQALYDSPWLATAALAVTSFVGLCAWLRRGSFLVAFVVLFTVEILADALRSGTWSPLHLLASPWEDAVGMGFVLAGDFRYFLLVERFAWRPKSGARDATAPQAWASSLGLMAIVPLLVLGLQKAYPARFADMRWSYLAYELLFVALVAGLRAGSLPRRLAEAPAAVRKWLLDVTHYEIAQYSLWALADVVILCGADAGFALRLVPNLMYYGLFVSFVAFRAPAEVRG
jgi:hypothetical protein